MLKLNQFNKLIFRNIIICSIRKHKLFYHTRKKKFN